MLVTMRRQGEALLVGDDIEITIVRIAGSRVRLGISAPRRLQVVAGEKRQKPADVPPSLGYETAEDVVGSQ